MSANKPNIQQIQDYLNGKLDARAMHKLEREAQNDPVLWDVLKGMEGGDAATHRLNLDAIDRLIDQRVERDNRRVIPMWQKASIAASLLIALGVGGWLFMNHESSAPGNPTVASKPIVAKPDKLTVDTPASAKPILPEGKPMLAKMERTKVVPTVARYGSEEISNVATAREDTLLNNFIASNVVDSSKSRSAVMLKSVNIKHNAPAAQYAAASLNAKLKAKNASALDSSLNKLLASSPPNMVIAGRTGNNTVLKQDTTSLSRNLLSKAAGVQVSTIDLKSRTYTQMVTGRVFDKDNHEILPGASVRVDGSTATTQTDANGKFTIAMPAGKETLNVGYLGYSNQLVQVKNNDSVNVTLAPNQGALSEVVVTGYGEAKKARSSVSSAHPGIGQKAYDKYLQDNATMPDGSTGTVKLSFTVETSGAISNITIVKGSTYGINQKAIQLIKNGPAWTPQSNGKPQVITLDIQFHK